MTTAQKIIKYFAIALALAIIAGILNGIMGAVGLLGAIGNNNEVTKDFKEYSVSSDIKELNIDVDAVKINIIEADAFSVSSNIKNLEVVDSGGVLSISEEYSFGKNFNEALINLYVPAEYQFENADIKIGAGELKADMLSASSISLKVGAGEASIKTLNAEQKTEIDGGAGEIVISDGTLNNLDLNIGVGEVALTSAVLGESDIDCGVGDARLTLIGSEEDYKIRLNMNIGNASVNGVKAEDGSVFGSGENEIKINGDVGSIDLDFKSSN